MLTLKVKVVGSGTMADPYRVNLPTYVARFLNHTEGWGIVYVPEEAHGLTPKDVAHEVTQDTSHGPLYPSLCDACVEKIERHMDDTYVEQRGKFKVEQYAG